MRLGNISYMHIGRSQLTVFGYLIVQSPKCKVLTSIGVDEVVIMVANLRLAIVLVRVRGGCHA